MTTPSQFVPTAVLITTLLATGAARAQQAFDVTICRAGTVTVLAQADGLIVSAIDQRGVAVSTGAKSPFDGITQRCMGVVANIAGKASGSGWCRSVDPKSGDWYVVDWTSSDKPGFGTFAYRHGIGKWKGITGGGTYEPLEQTRPVDPGTYQNCNRSKGTFSIPG